MDLSAFRNSEEEHDESGNSLSSGDVDHLDSDSVVQAVDDSSESTQNMNRNDDGNNANDYVAIEITPKSIVTQEKDDVPREDVCGMALGNSVDNSFKEDLCAIGLLSLANNDSDHVRNFKNEPDGTDGSQNTVQTRKTVEKSKHVSQRRNSDVENGDSEFEYCDLLDTTNSDLEAENYLATSSAVTHVSSKENDNISGGNDEPDAIMTPEHTSNEKKIQDTTSLTQQILRGYDEDGVPIYDYSSSVYGVEFFHHNKEKLNDDSIDSTNVVQCDKFSLESGNESGPEDDLSLAEVIATTSDNEIVNPKPLLCEESNIDNEHNIDTGYTMNAGFILAKLFDEFEAPVLSHKPKCTRTYDFNVQQCGCFDGQAVISFRKRKVYPKRRFRLLSIERKYRVDKYLGEISRLLEDDKNVMKFMTTLQTAPSPSPTCNHSKNVDASLLGNIVPEKAKERGISIFQQENSVDDRAHNISLDLKVHSEDAEDAIECNISPVPEACALDDTPSIERYISKGEKDKDKAISLEIQKEAAVISCDLSFQTTSMPPLRSLQDYDYIQTENRQHHDFESIPEAEDTLKNNTLDYHNETRSELRNILSADGFDISDSKEVINLITQAENDGEEFDSPSNDDINIGDTVTLQLNSNKINYICTQIDCDGDDPIIPCDADHTNMTLSTQDITEYQTEDENLGNSASVSLLEDRTRVPNFNPTKRVYANIMKNLKR